MSQALIPQKRNPIDRLLEDMDRVLMPSKGSSKVMPLEEATEDMFSADTHPVLEDFIQKVIDANRDTLVSINSQKLVREFLLYGFMKASDQEFWWKWENERYVCPLGDEDWRGLFCTNNGVLALCDFDGQVYIRGGDSYHGYSGIDPEERPKGVEGTLLRFGYRPGIVYVPHSNGERYSDTNMERLFRLLHYFSKNVRHLRGEATHGLIIKDLSEPEPQAPYQPRAHHLPRIVLKDMLLIPGNKERTYVID